MKLPNDVMTPLPHFAAPFWLRAAAIVIAAGALPVSALVSSAFAQAPKQQPVKIAAPQIKAAPKPRPFSSTMQFYVAKGEAGECGKGCDTWIAVEGEVDRNAAPRFRKFLRQVKGRNLPVYFFSPAAK